MPKGATLPVTLKVLEYELFHVCPLKVKAQTDTIYSLNEFSIQSFPQPSVQEITRGISFAPIGLLNMFNSGAAVEQSNNMLNEDRSPSATVVLRVRGCGQFGAYLSRKPIRCTLDSSEVDSSYNSVTGLLTINIPVPEMEMYKWNLEIQV